MKDFSEQDEAAKRQEEAAAWRMRLAEDGGRPPMTFDLWLRLPGSQAAWDAVNRIWNVFDDAAELPEMAAMRQAALADVARAGRRMTWHRLARPVQAMAAAIVLLCLAGGGGYWWLTQPNDYQTGRGERRVVTLSDGSRLSLDSDSEVTVQYASHRRSLHLVRGQARFDVAHDRSRPFSVVAGNERVVATGTAFNIDMAGSKVLVTLIEGHVVVLNEDDGASQSLQGPERIELRAGQQLAASANAPPHIVTASIPRVTAWTVGQLAFDNEPLASVVDRINRYSDAQIVITDPGIGNLKISGVFNAGDAQGFVNIVTRYLRVRAVTDDPHTITLQGVTQ